MSIGGFSSIIETSTDETCSQSSGNSFSGIPTKYLDLRRITIEKLGKLSIKESGMLTVLKSIFSEYGKICRTVSIEEDILFLKSLSHVSERNSMDKKKDDNCTIGKLPDRIWNIFTDQTEEHPCLLFMNLYIDFITEQLYDIIKSTGKSIRFSSVLSVYSRIAKDGRVVIDFITNRLQSNPKLSEEAKKKGFHIPQGTSMYPIQEMNEIFIEVVTNRLNVSSPNFSEIIGVLLSSDLDSEIFLRKREYLSLERLGSLVCGEPDFFKKISKPFSDTMRELSSLITNNINISSQIKCIGNAAKILLKDMEKMKVRCSTEKDLELVMLYTVLHCDRKCFMPRYYIILNLLKVFSEPFISRKEEKESMSLRVNVEEEEEETEEEEEGEISTEIAGYILRLTPSWKGYISAFHLALDESQESKRIFGSLSKVEVWIERFNEMVMAEKTYRAKLEMMERKNRLALRNEKERLQREYEVFRKKMSKRYQMLRRKCSEYIQKEMVEKVKKYGDKITNTMEREMRLKEKKFSEFKAKLGKYEQEMRLEKEKNEKYWKRIEEYETEKEMWEQDRKRLEEENRDLIFEKEEEKESKKSLQVEKDKLEASDEKMKRTIGSLRKELGDKTRFYCQKLENAKNEVEDLKEKLMNMKEEMDEMKVRLRRNSKRFPFFPDFGRKRRTSSASSLVSPKKKVVIKVPTESSTDGSDNLDVKRSEFFSHISFVHGFVNDGGAADIHIPASEVEVLDLIRVIFQEEVERGKEYFENLRLKCMNLSVVTSRWKNEMVFVRDQLEKKLKRFEECVIENPVRAIFFQWVYEFQPSLENFLRKLRKTYDGVQGIEKAKTNTFKGEIGGTDVKPNEKKLGEMFYSYFEKVQAIKSELDRKLKIEKFSRFVNDFMEVIGRTNVCLDICEFLRKNEIYDFRHEEHSKLKPNWKNLHSDLKNVLSKHYGFEKLTEEAKSEDVFLEFAKRLNSALFHDLSKGGSLSPLGIILRLNSIDSCEKLLHTLKDFRKLDKKKVLISEALRKQFALFLRIFFSLASGEEFDKYFPLVVKFRHVVDYSQPLDDEGFGVAHYCSLFDNLEVIARLRELHLNEFDIYKASRGRKIVKRSYLPHEFISKPNRDKLLSGESLPGGKSVVEVLVEDCQRILGAKEFEDMKKKCVLISHIRKREKGLAKCLIDRFKDMKGKFSNGFVKEYCRLVKNLKILFFDGGGYFSFQKTYKKSWMEKTQPFFGIIHPVTTERMGLGVEFDIEGEDHEYEKGEDQKLEEEDDDDDEGEEEEEVIIMEEVSRDKKKSKKKKEKKNKNKKNKNKRKNKRQKKNELSLRCSFFGYFKQGLRHGDGEEYDFPSKGGEISISFKGEFKNGMRDGKGVEYYLQNGYRCIRFEGKYRKNKRDGRGDEIYPLNRIGEWKDGKLIRTYDELVPHFAMEYNEKSAFANELKESNSVSSGSFGTVYRVNRSFLPVDIEKAVPDGDSEVAVKILKLEGASSLEKKLFEGGLVRAIGLLGIKNGGECENLVRIIARIDDKKKDFSLKGYVMELGDDVLLERLLPKKSQNLGKHKVPTLYMNEKVRVLYEVSKGMLFLQEKIPVMHRDLKWDNVVSKGQTIKIMDFDTLKEDERHRRVNTNFPLSAVGPVGTPGYTSPESFYDENQRTGKSAKYMSEGDVYSFGIMIYTLLFGHRHPYSLSCSKDCSCTCGSKIRILCEFGGKSINKHVAKCGLRPYFSKELVKDFPPFLIELMKFCWSQNPFIRPSFKTIVAVFERYINIKKKGEEEDEGEEEEEEEEGFDVERKGGERHAIPNIPISISGRNGLYSVLTLKFPAYRGGIGDIRLLFCFVPSREGLVKRIESMHKDRHKPKVDKLESIKGERIDSDKALRELFERNSEYPIVSVYFVSYYLVKLVLYSPPEKEGKLQKELLRERILILGDIPTRKELEQEIVKEVKSDGIKGKISVQKIETLEGGSAQSIGTDSSLNNLLLGTFNPVLSVHLKISGSVSKNLTSGEFL